MQRLSLCSHIYMGPVTEKNGNWACQRPSPFKVSFPYLHLTWFRRYKSILTQETFRSHKSTNGGVSHRGTRNKGTQLSNLSVLLYYSLLEAAESTPWGGGSAWASSPWGKRQQHQPPETSMDVSLLCFLFRNFIQIDIKIVSRITLSSVLSYGPLPESPP